MCDCLGQESENPVIQEAIDKVNDQIDSFTKSMINDERNNTQKEVEENPRQEFIARDIITQFPPPYDGDETMIGLNCFKDGEVPASESKVYSIPSVDEYYGDLSFFDNMCYYGKYSNGILGYGFNENDEPPSKADWSESKDDIHEARRYFQGIIGHPIYGVKNINALQKDTRNNAPETFDGRNTLERKQLNDWEEVDINNLGDKNQILSALLGDTFEGDTSDMWISLIAFCGYGSHRTGPIQKSQQHQSAYFVNDVTFLSLYNVRQGYVKYGAAAYFDAKYHLTEIFLSHNGKTYKPPNEGGQIQTWEHAKWAWKVSVSVATFLVDMLAHSRFRESSGLIKALRNNLSPDHPIRRLLLPFTLGTVYANRIFNEFLRENGLYHRAFAFKYKSLQRLIKDSMSSAPTLKQDEQRTKEQKMMYRFRLFRKKVVIMKKLPDEIYPIYTDVWDYWVQTLKFVEEYVQQYYNADDTDDSVLTADKDLENFYNELLDNLGIADKYRLKKFNIINILTHFVCNATIWNHHLNTSVSFEYSIDIDFTGLKISGPLAKRNSILDYAQYLLVVLSKGWQLANLQSDWSVVLLEDTKSNETKKIFKQYFENQLDTVTKNIMGRNKQRIAPYNGCNPQYCPASIKL